MLWSISPKMSYTIPPMVVVIVWGISHVIGLRTTSTIFHRQIWISSISGAFLFECDETRDNKFFDAGQVSRAELIHKKRSEVGIEEASGFLFVKSFSRAVEFGKVYEIKEGSGFIFAKWYAIRMIRVPYWAIFSITLIGTVTWYVANRVRTRC